MQQNSCLVNGYLQADKLGLAHVLGPGSSVSAYSCSRDSPLGSQLQAVGSPAPAPSR